MDSTATGWSRVCILWRGGVSCLVSAAWHFCVAAHWSKYHCYKQAPSWYDLRCFKATLNPNKQTKTYEVISRRCLLVAMVLWPMCCHTGIPRRRHRTRHPTPSQYTDTGPTCRCAIHWCGTSHWNTQLPVSKSWVRPEREILPWPSTHTSERSTLWYWYGGNKSEVW